MPLLAGTRLGPYDIVGPLGAGGMGEVFRARDPRLHREVAIKGLPDTFARNPERLARFEREARLLASLSHPNIAAIFGLEDDAGTPYLVLELVEGETLAQRLARGALSARETLEFGGQIAAAIEAAHEREVVHRDLKPGNIMITPARIVKVLDFGLAKGGATEAGSSPSLSASPTMGLSATGEGMILGTAAYMSPEQARAQSVDRRTDVWSFGCVLFECLSGQPTFGGETVSDIIARILEREPDWSAIPASTPARLRDLVRRCLTKDAARRPRDIGDLRHELHAIAADLAAGAGTQAPAAATTPSLAVLYFENLTNDEESAYFCSGITEDILTDLSKIKGLRVASRNAVGRYRGGPVDIPRAAAEMGVGAVLEGSVRRAGQRVRISAQLIAADGFHLWAERYDRTMEDVFKVQEEIASSIAAALQVALTPAESKKLVKDRPEEVRAYDLYLKGRAEYGKYTEASLREALALFEQATALDPGYALAWAGISDCYGQLAQWEKDADVADLTRRGLEAARHAISLNPRLPDAYKAEALNLMHQGDHDGARAALTRAVEADPRFFPAMINLGVNAFIRADVAAAERFIRRALEIDPQEPFATTWLALLLRFTGRHDQAIAAGRRCAELSRDRLYVTGAHVIPALVHLERGETAAAEQFWREGVAAGARPEEMRALEAAIAAQAGREEHARDLIRALGDTAGMIGPGLDLAARAAVRVGEHETATRLMSQMVIAKVAPTWVRLAPGLHPLLDLPPLAPRRCDTTLVWPLEAPMIDRARFMLFREVRIDTGLPEGSDVR
ncbi:MAG TPA: protein kinase [Candidatus Eisenbacteria bacterium]|nr:protein kinase [Candidatus Eisenbacteria bacterium]